MKELLFGIQVFVKLVPVPVQLSWEGLSHREPRPFRLRTGRVERSVLRVSLPTDRIGD